MKALRLRARSIVPVGRPVDLAAEGRKEEAQDRHYIAFELLTHNERYTLASVATLDGRTIREERVDHERDTLRQFLEGCDRGSPVAVETTGNWYWIVDEIEAAGCVPRLVHARKAKLMLGMINKTDKLGARGLNRLQQAGTLPTVWIPPGDLQDRRDLPRTRMMLVRQRTQLKNRIHATLAKFVPNITLRRPWLRMYCTSSGG
jgi:transposase